MREGERVARDHARILRRAMTRAETILWTVLCGRTLGGAKFRRQHPIGSFVVDFACLAARLAIEVDGATHSTEDEVAYDAWRSYMLAEYGWRVIRVTNADVYTNLDGVVRLIGVQLLQEDAPPPSRRAAPRPL